MMREGWDEEKRGQACPRWGSSQSQIPSSPTRTFSCPSASSDTAPPAFFGAEKEHFWCSDLSALSMPGLWDTPRISLLPGRSWPHPDPSEGWDREGVGRAAASIFMRLQRIQAFKYSSGTRSLSLPAGTGGGKREEGTKNGKRGRKTGRGDEQPPVSRGRGAASAWGCDIRALSPAEGRAGAGCRE